jgi:hypothetical protein
MNHDHSARELVLGFNDELLLDAWRDGYISAIKDMKNDAIKARDEDIMESAKKFIDDLLEMRWLRRGRREVT